ncbi:NAD(P)-dependent dehydrogenase, short-chain alcohol dehydrogenase family [Asanoa hainanensis]|uniref:NAD(P)-dependent dehydrogenase, short-chain alcohol dehydrogenase family n=1 Tax=Asanoa hainanensis TaxID=560556 RepID=A0A239MZ44_9ACTN|nr:oxidoreductase [Asanoa hainanensis]SNT48001.1 NAD(P)-dependent dehydrogenase, short-chain alcohol dehydrogenase family [Asanoa hainanensis]
MNFTGKVAVVTGAGKGIGAAVTRRLLDAGAQVVAGSRAASTDLARLAGPEALATVDVDLSTPDGPGRLVAVATERFGGLDVLVNNMGGLAGGGPRFGGFLSVTDADWSRAVELNLLSAVRATRAAVPALLARGGGGGGIVNVGPINAALPDPSVVDYAATKAALANLGKSLSAEFAPQGIRVNTVSPGPVLTPFWTAPGALADQLATAIGTDTDGAMRAMADGLGGIKLGRFGTADEIAQLVVFLASPAAAWMTGSDVVIDGGLTKTL